MDLLLRGLPSFWSPAKRSSITPASIPFWSSAATSSGLSLMIRRFSVCCPVKWLSVSLEAFVPVVLPLSLRPVRPLPLRLAKPGWLHSSSSDSLSGEHLGLGGNLVPLDDLGNPIAAALKSCSSIATSLTSLLSDPYSSSSTTSRPFPFTSRVFSLRQCLNNAPSRPPRTGRQPSAHNAPFYPWCRPYTLRPGAI